MTHTSSQLNAAIDPNLDNEQSTAIIEAILAGKYSWACVLMLRSAGRNPLHYIPYRTYNRLVKEEMQKRNTMRNPTANSSHTKPAVKAQIRDLAYVDSVVESPSEVIGGTELWNHRSPLSKTAQNHRIGEPRTRTVGLPIWQPEFSRFQYM